MTGKKQKLFHLLCMTANIPPHTLKALDIMGI